jgi:hypothetical protein
MVAKSAKVLKRHESVYNRLQRLFGDWYERLSCANAIIPSNKEEPTTFVLLSSDFRTACLRPSSTADPQADMSVIQVRQKRTVNEKLPAVKGFVSSSSSSWST